ncbi:hypothetical protein I0Q91_03770 [Halanaerobiaceae bacterium Z-7014]|uniref:DUF2268 domain-containing protein n=1 Tax=Halonatronomonas betaini TaxID=2778430 RepID=A0A931APP7_9FIRM|nr:DUF2268 domain-containing putative Zn-dependent protease [Halonatronomonas betaini]MBF8436187.1 hypothetical protein [Halonatronomonas betaini]
MIKKSILTWNLIRRKRYREHYYLPNQRVLDNHFSRWGSSDIHKLKEMVAGWKKAKFKPVIEAIEDFKFIQVEETIKEANSILGEIKDFDIYFLIGDFRSGLYIDQINNRNIIVIAMEVVREYGDLEKVILPSISHELFHIYHYSRLKKEGINREKSFKNLIVDDGLAAYFSSMLNSSYNLQEILLYSDEQLEQIKANEAEYGRQLFKLIEEKSLDESILLFNAPKAMQEEKLTQVPDWPPRLSYYYGFKIIESYIQEHGKDYIKELTLIPPEKVIAESRISGKR